MSPENSTHQAAPWLTAPVAIIIAGVIIGVSLIVALKGTGGSKAEGGSQPAPSVAVNVKDIDISKAAYIGKPNAPVTLVSWEDSQCPFCKKFETEVLPTLVKNYVDTGKVKIVFKHYEFLGPNSTLAGEWTLAIWKLYPTRYWDWRQAWFQQQPQENSLSPSQFEAHLAKVTSGAGIDTGKIRADVAKNKAAYDAALAADQAEGGKYGVNGTPGFITGKVRIDGAQPLENFVAVLDPQLK